MTYLRLILINRLDKIKLKELERKNFKMTKTNIIIADTSIELAYHLEQLIDKDPTLNLLAATSSGTELLTLINEETPDIILMDLILRDLDGLDVLKSIGELPSHKRPKILILSSIWNEITLDIVLQYDVHYYLLKPMQVESIVNRIKNFSGTINYVDNVCHEQLTVTHLIDTVPAKPTVRHMTSKLLSQLGFPVHISAYNYLIDAVDIVVNNPCAINMVTKNVYPIVAAKYNTLGPRVERSLRYLIETVWKSINDEILYEHFALSLRVTDKPSSSELIAVISDKIRLELAAA